MTETILIVDDSTFIIEGLVAILKKSYRPLAAYSGEQCLEILKSEKPDIIILDILMEPMDGWETLARIKTNPQTRDIPVLMFSAKKISPEEAEEHRISIDEFISKPVTPHKLIEAIENVLSRKKANRADIENWKDAGIEQVKIDEYITLTTNLEVDLGLLQNMKVQHDLVHDDKNNLDLLEKEITAIEQRVHEEKRHAEELSRELHTSVTAPAEVNGYTRLIKETPFVNPVHPSVIYENSTEVQAATIHTPVDKVNQAYPTASAAPASDKLLHTRISAVSIPVKDSMRPVKESPVIPQEPVKEPADIIPPVNPSVPCPQINGHEIPGREKSTDDLDNFTLYEPDNTDTGSEDRSISPSALFDVHDKPVSGSVGMDTQENPPASPALAVTYAAQQPRPLKPEIRKVNPESPPGRSDTGDLAKTRHFGSGTNTSMNKGTINESRSLEKMNDETNNKKIHGKRTSSVFGSLISNIISVIRGIFHRPGK
jgi:CheY-like chemotaxis protein